MNLSNNREMQCSNRRRTARASVVTMNAYQYLELINISATGAKLRGSPLPDIGKTALFRLQDIQLLCKIMWATDNQCGVRFEELVPLKMVARIREAGTPAAIAMLTPDEKLAADDWLVGNAP